MKANHRATRPPQPFWMGRPNSAYVRKCKRNWAKQRQQRKRHPNWPRKYARIV